MPRCWGIALQEDEAAQPGSTGPLKTEVLSALPRFGDSRGLSGCLAPKFSRVAILETPCALRRAERPCGVKGSVQQLGKVFSFSLEQRDGFALRHCAGIQEILIRFLPVQS